MTISAEQRAWLKDLGTLVGEPAPVDEDETDDGARGTPARRRRLPRQALANLPALGEEGGDEPGDGDAGQRFGFGPEDILPVIPDLIDEINDHLQKLDRILGKLDKRLTNSLTNALETQDPTLRDAALQESKTILAEYIRYVRAEPLIEHLDNNPFGVKTDLKATIAKSLTQVAKAIG